MSAGAKVGSKCISTRTPFAALAQQVFALDPAIEWVAWEEAGREPHWTWRDAETGKLCGGAAQANAQLVDPLLFLVAEGCDDISREATSANPHRLLFVMLAYADLVQIVIRLGADAHVSVAVSPGVDPHLLGTKLIGLLDRYTHQMNLN